MSGNRMMKAVKLFFSHSNQLVYGHKMRHKIKKIKKELDVISANRHSFHFLERPIEAPYIRKGRDQTYSFKPKKNIVGRDNDKVAILERLLKNMNTSENVVVIPIVGLGGLGKTTLAQLVYNDDKLKDVFQMKIWVCVSDEFEIKKIVEKAIKSITDQDTGRLELEQLQGQLRRDIGGKKFLLILDDVWNEDINKWDQLKELLMDGAKGSRIIVTTRSNKVAEIMSELPPYELKGLSVDDSWSLCVKIVFRGEEPDDQGVIEIGKAIVKNCAGVPLAIKTIAALLCFKNPKTEWLPFMKNEFSKLPQKEDDILPTLRLSYNHLPSHMKHCFAYCKLFPKDHEIDVQMLIQLWIAQGFVRSSSNVEGQCLEDIGLEYFKDLLWRSFFQEAEHDRLGNLRSCKMHDLMHDLAMLVGGEKTIISISHENIQQVNESTRHIAFREEFTDWDPTHLNKVQKLRTFLALDTFIKLPTSIVKLQNLQVLNLSDCGFLEGLPKDITKLVNLRHLDCEGCYTLTHMPRGIGQLTSLMTLGLFVVSENRVSKQMGRLNELNLLNNLRGNLRINHLGYVKNGISEFEAANLKEKQHLQSLTLDWGDGEQRAEADYDDVALQSLQPHPNLKGLGVWNYRGLRFPSWVSSLINLVNISLIDCKRCKHLPPLDRLPSLQSLYIYDFDDLESIDIDEGDNCLNKGGGATFFPSLKSLTIWNCPNLKGSGKKGDYKNAEPLQFPCLSSLRIWNCPKLTRMPLFPTLDEELELRKVSGAPLLLMMTMTISASPPDGASSSSSLMLPLSKLKNLSMEGMIDLESLPLEGLQNLTSLQKLLIEDCSSLKYLPKEMQLLTNLQELEITRCPQLEKRCENNKSVDWPHIAHIPNIKIGALTIQRDGKYMLDD